jgi:hypothetical protein
MKRITSLRLFGLGLLAAVTMILISGCTTNEPENTSSRPWNTPKSWEHGLPSIMNEGR